MNSAFQKICHPATLQLLRHQTGAKLTRIASAFRSPRRKCLAILAVVLGCLWISQAVASVLFRQPAEPAQLRLWIPLGLFVYTLWHLVKISTRKPTEPFEWTPAELELVCAAPISRTQLISYRMASILSSATLKALCFSIVMIPDLNCWVFGLFGMFLGLFLVDLFRVGFELFFHALSRRGRVVARTTILGTLAGIGVFAFINCLGRPQATVDVASPGSLLFFQSLIVELLDLMRSSIGAALLLPFQSFSELILAGDLSFRTIGFAFISVLVVFAGAAIVYRMDGWMTYRSTVKELENFRRRSINQKSNRPKSSNNRNIISVPLRMRGFGCLAWRQLLGAYHYRMTLVVSLGIPILLCCIPLMADHEPFFMLLNIVGGLVFYSFLLLPSALMLDFRRDVHRIAVLKAMPIGPTAVTLGQLAAPVLICTVFQWSVLFIAVLSGSVIVWQAIVACVLLIPVNTLIFALENFIFMLSPYRRNQEGLDVFLRTILTFTGKGILFALGLAMLVTWAFASKAAAEFLGVSGAGAGLLFGLGVWLMTISIAATFVFGIIQIYDRFDASQDAPAVS